MVRLPIILEDMPHNEVIADLTLQPVVGVVAVLVVGLAVPGEEWDIIVLPTSRSKRVDGYQESAFS